MLEELTKEILVLVDGIVPAWFIYPGVEGELFLYWFWYRVVSTPTISGCRRYRKYKIGGYNFNRGIHNNTDRVNDYCAKAHTDYIYYIS